MSGQVYAVASGKGGVGKTTTVVNLGVTLRAADHTVALVDADLGMANLATLLSVEGEPTLHDVLAGDASVDDALVEPTEGFGVLPGTRELEGFAAADPTRLGEAVAVLQERYDYVLVDTGAGLSLEDVLPLGLVDAVVLVTSPDPAAVGDTEKTIEVAELVDAAILGVVVTRATAAEAETIADRLGVDLLVAIPDDAVVPESTARGEPLEAYASESGAAEGYRRLAATVAERTPVPSVEATATMGGDDEAGAQAAEAGNGGDPEESEATDAEGAGETGGSDETTEGVEPAPEGESVEEASEPAGDGEDAEEPAESEDGEDEGDAEEPAEPEGEEDEKLAEPVEPEDGEDEGDVEEPAEPEGEEDEGDAEEPAESEGEEAKPESEGTERSSGGLFSWIGRLFR